MSTPDKKDEKNEKTKLQKAIETANRRIRGSKKSIKEKKQKFEELMSHNCLDKLKDLESGVQIVNQLESINQQLVKEHNK